MPVQKPLAEYTVKVYPDSIDVTMKNPENLNPGKIQNHMMFILRKWQKFQQQEVIKQRRKEAAEASEKESNDAA